MSVYGSQYPSWSCSRLNIVYTPSCVASAFDLPLVHHKCLIQLFLTLSSTQQARAMYFWAGPLQICLISSSFPLTAQTYATCIHRHSVILLIMTCKVAARSDEVPPLRSWEDCWCGRQLRPNSFVNELQWLIPSLHDTPLSLPICGPN